MSMVPDGWTRHSTPGPACLLRHNHYGMEVLIDGVNGAAIRLTGPPPPPAEEGPVAVALTAALEYARDFYRVQNDLALSTHPEAP